MNTEVTTLRPGTSIREAEEILSKKRLGGAPVVDEKDRPIGVVSQHDLIALESVRATADSMGRFYTDVEDYRELASEPASHADEPVASVMTRGVVTIRRDASALEAARLMRERRIHRLLVVEDEVLVGIVTSFDLLGALDEEA